LDLEQISALKPDALGFVLWPKSKRFIRPEAVGQWNTPAGIRRVGVFVNPSQDELRYAASVARLDVLQVHRVPVDWKIDRRNFQGLEIWRALNADESQTLESDFLPDCILIDSYDPKTVGGTGKTCDWYRARKLVQTLDIPVILAGGLSPENVAEAIRIVRPWGVDASSSVEKEPGQKDIARVASFISAVHHMDNIV